MTQAAAYVSETLTRAEVDALAGATVLNFGANWCEHCQAAQTPVMQAMAAHAGVRHIKIEDGAGRPLGRSYRVKLWPTLIFLKDGVEVDRVVRPVDSAALLQALARIDAQA